MQQNSRRSFMSQHQVSGRSARSWLRAMFLLALVSSSWLALPIAAAAPRGNRIPESFRDSSAAINAVMARSVDAWAAGDLHAFMQSYEDSPDTLFVGAQGIVRGKAAIGERYATQFGSGGPGRLGTLTFDVLELRSLGTDYALMIGRYRLQPPDPSKPQATGIFSLVFHKRGSAWRILSDHTS